ncbi:MAG: aldehyde dehydrogenase family protein, partial [Saprospiraceae bacterium]|nr:aldehyde dehydrogenase family protein [Saprospiraceae bacterium]
MLETKNYIHGTYVEDSYEKVDIISPVDGSLISTMPMSDASAVDKAVRSSKKAFLGWSSMTLKERVQIFFRFRTLLEKHRDELVELVHKENGKTLSEAAAEVDKGIELCEFACSLP